MARRSKQIEGGNILIPFCMRWAGCLNYAQGNSARPSATHKHPSAEGNCVNADCLRYSEYELITTQEG